MIDLREAFLFCSSLLAAASCLLAGCQSFSTPGSFDPAAWKHHERLRVIERAKASVRGFPVSFELDVAELVDAGKCRPDLGDLRITIAGKEVPVQVEKLDGGKASVTFQIDLARQQSREDVCMHYGNPWATMPDYDGRWGTISKDRNAFENELLRVSYGLKTSTFRKMWGCQKEFTIKWYDEDQFGGDKIPDSWAKSRNDVTYWQPVPKGGPRFEIEVDGPIYKRVRFFSPERTIIHHPGAKPITAKDVSQRVTFYRGCPFIKEQLHGLKTGTTTTAVPGGMRLRSKGQRNFDFAAYNLKPEEITWEGRGQDTETRGGFTSEKKRAEDDPRYRWMGDHSYNDHLIMGVFNMRNGRGVGSCATDVRTAFFVDWSHERAGFSIWPKAGSMTRYLYYVETGRTEVISRGKLLAAPPTVVRMDRPVSATTDDWGSIKVFEDSAGGLHVTLENSKVRVLYETFVPQDTQTYIRRFELKEHGHQSQGYWLDAAAHRRGLRCAEIVRDDSQAKTVRMVWNGSDRSPSMRGPAISEVTIYPESMILRIDVLQSAFAHVCDIGTPGGAGRRAPGPQFSIYGAAEWQQARKAIEDTQLRDHPNEHHRLTDDLHPIYPFPLMDRTWPADPMSYKGWYILATYDPESGRGYGRVVPAKAITYMKLLAFPANPGFGFELFPHWQETGRNRKPYTTYLFAETGGADKIIAKGKLIADRASGRYVKDTQQSREGRR